MKRLLLVSALAFAGCLHAKQREDPQPQPGPDQQPAQAPRANPPQKPTEKERPPDEPGRPHLSSEAEGLLTPEGPRLIQEALSKRGYLPREHQSGELDVETSNALRRFQEDEHAPRTGYPDRETVRKLGLEVEKVFKSTGARSPGSDR